MMAPSVRIGQSEHPRVGEYHAQADGLVIVKPRHLIPQTYLERVKLEISTSANNISTGRDDESYKVAVAYKNN